MISPAPSEVAPPPTRSSAKVHEPQKVGKFDALSETLAQMGAAADFDNPPPPEGNSNPPEADGYPFSDRIQWERKRTDGSLEAWHKPDGTKRNRAGKTYIARIGKRRLTELEQLAPEKMFDELRRWVIEKAAGKGIAL